MSVQSLSLVLFSVGLTVLAQLCLKRGAMALSAITASSDGLFALIINLAKNHFLIGGLGIYAISAVTWIMALSKVNVSLAYPFVGLGIVGTSLAGYYWFNEPLSANGWIGIALVVIGLIVIARG